MKPLLLLSLALCMFSVPAWATITIDPGTYEIPALVKKGPKGPVAIFNLRSSSETRILLQGENARKLALEGLRGLLIRIRVAKKIAGPHGEALLESVSELGDRRIPLQVGNHFKPVP